MWSKTSFEETKLVMAMDMDAAISEALKEMGVAGLKEKQTQLHLWPNSSCLLPL